MNDGDSYVSEQFKDEQWRIQTGSGEGVDPEKHNFFYNTTKTRQIISP